MNKARDRSAVDVKSGESFSADSAIWYVEAALNYSLGDVVRACKILSRDTLVLSVGEFTETIQPAAVYDAFNALYPIVAPLTTEEQHVAVVDVVEPEMGAAELMVIVTLGSGYDKGAPNSVYGPKAYRYFLNSAQSTICDCQPPPNTPQSVWCANKEIEQRINAANVITLAPTQYITDVETWQTWNFTDLAGKKIMPLELELAGPLPISGGYHASKTFTLRNGASHGSTCLTPSEMTFWTGNATQGTWSAITAIKGVRCPNKTFLNCWIGGSINAVFFENGSTPVAGQWSWHHCTFTYGRIVDGIFGGG